MATRQHPNFSNLSVKLFGFESQVQKPTNQELAMQGFKVFNPKTFEAYVEPTSNPIWSWQGKFLAKLLSKNHTFIHGPSGCGKNYLVEYVAHKLNIPFQEFSFKVGSNPNDMLKRSTLKEVNGVTVSEDEEGNLAKALKGCEIIRNGEKQVIPAIILFSDVDRADPQAFDLLREALEKGAERINDPMSGAMIPIAKGTVFVFTANRGLDESEEGMLTNPIDASMGSRIVGVMAKPLAKQDYKRIAQKYCPSLKNNEVNLLVDCLLAMKKVVDEECIDVLPLSARQLPAMIDEYKFIKDHLQGVENCVRYACSGIIDKLRNEGFRIALEGAIDPYVKSDAIEFEEEDDDDIPPCDR